MKLRTRVSDLEQQNRALGVLFQQRIKPASDLLLQVRRPFTPGKEVLGCYQHSLSSQLTTLTTKLIFYTNPDKRREALEHGSLVVCVCLSCLLVQSEVVLRFIFVV